MWPYYAEDEIEAVAATLTSGKVNYWTGERGKEFERAFAAFTGTRYALSFCNGSVALEAALRALSIGPGDEVITTSRSFIASASCASMVGATPVFADVDRDSQNITANTAEPLITQKTRAIIAVHLAGWPCDMDPILDLARKRGLYVIEDCSQSHGATYHNRTTGSMGDIGVFSFCQDKIISTGGEGGAITLNDPALYEAVWSLRDHGKDRVAMNNMSTDSGFKYIHNSVGSNMRMTEVQSAIGLLQLAKLSEWLLARRNNASILKEELGSVASVHIPKADEGVKRVYYKFYIFLRPEKLKESISRDTILKKINAQGVPCFSGSCPEIYREKAFSPLFDQLPVRPNASALGETSLMFLVHPTLGEDEMRAMGRIAKKVILEGTRE